MYDLLQNNKCSNRKNLPKKQLAEKNMVRGERPYINSFLAVAWSKWKDKRVVILLSNFHNGVVEK